MQKVRIRFLGDKWYKGIPRKRFIDVGGERFYNHPRFREQMDDGSYIRPAEFYLKYKHIFDNKQLFVVEMHNDSPPPVGTDGRMPGTPSVLTPELAEKGVVEVDGILGCPQCEYVAENPKAMTMHLVEHE